MSSLHNADIIWMKYLVLRFLLASATRCPRSWRVEWLLQRRGVYDLRKMVPRIVGIASRASRCSPSSRTDCDKVVGGVDFGGAVAGRTARMRTIPAIHGQSGGRHV